MRPIDFHHAHAEHSRTVRELDTTSPMYLEHREEARAQVEGEGGRGAQVEGMQEEAREDGFSEGTRI